jgi:hypothetical protein
VTLIETTMRQWRDVDATGRVLHEWWSRSPGPVNGPDYPLPPPQFERQCRLSDGSWLTVFAVPS